MSIDDDVYTTTLFPHAQENLGCNCQYPIGLVIFLLFVCLSLLVCICVCCIDVSKCAAFRQKDPPLLHKASTFDPRFFDSAAIERKFSVDPRLLEMAIPQPLASVPDRSSFTYSFDRKLSIDPRMLESQASSVQAKHPRRRSLLDMGYCSFGTFAEEEEEEEEEFVGGGMPGLVSTV